MTETVSGSSVLSRKSYAANYLESTQNTAVELYAKREIIDGQPKPKETIDDIIWRVAQAAAIAELRYVYEPNEIVHMLIGDALEHPLVIQWAQTFADAIGSQVYWHNTPANINSDPAVSLMVLQYEAYGHLLGFSIDDIWLKQPELIEHFNDYLGPPSDKSADYPQTFYRYQMGRIASALRGKGCLAACGVMFADDSLDGIMRAAKVEAVAAQASMGMGINTSSIRPWSSPVSNGAAASGPDRFYEKAISSAVASVAQGGRRGGALIELRNSDHPDILFFIEKKRLIKEPDFASVYKECLDAQPDAEPSALIGKAQKKFGKLYAEYTERQNYLRNTNISVLVMPGFMEAVKEKRWYQAQFNGKPWTGKIYDPTKPVIDEKTKRQKVNKTTKELEFHEYKPDLTKYPEAGLKQTFAQGMGWNWQGYLYAPDVFDRIIDGMRTSGEPGLLFYDTINDTNPNRSVYDLNTCNPCLHEDTVVLTKQGYFAIKDLVGKTVDVWDGNSWVSVDNFRVTAENQPLLEIEMVSGWSIKATPNHTFILDDGRKIQAKDLQGDMRLLQHDVQIHGNHKESAAYLKGFLIGDGGLAQGNPDMWLYRNKFVCRQRLIDSGNELPPTNRYGSTIQELGFIGFGSNLVAAKPARSQSKTHSRVQMQGLSARKDELHHWAGEYKSRLPIVEMLNWSLGSKCDFIAGLFDADGSAQDSIDHGFRYQIWNVSKQLLLDLQTLLSSIGVHSQFGLGKKAESKDFGARGGICETQDCWRLSLNQADSIVLSTLVTFTRLKSFADRKIINKSPRRWAQIKSVTSAGIAENVYCCTVPTSHQFAISHNLSVGNCGEQVLPVGPGKDGRFYMGICNLSSMHAAHKSFWNADGTYDYAAMQTAAQIQLRAMDNVIDVSWFPFPEQNLTARLERRTGGGFAGVGEFLARQFLRLGSDAACLAVTKLYAKYTTALLDASLALVAERGAYPLCDKSLYPQSVRNTCMANNAPTGTLAQMLQTGWGIEPFDGIVFERKVRTEIISFTAPGFLDVMEQSCGVDWVADNKERIVQAIKDNGFSAQGIGLIPEAVQRAFPIRKEITPQEYMKHLEAVYKGASVHPYCFNSVSNTCSIPGDTPSAFLRAAVIQAWESKIKAISVYPDGARISQPIEQITKDAQTEKPDLLKLLGASSVKARKLDLTETDGSTYKVKVGSDEGIATMHITLNQDSVSEGTSEVYLKIGKAGTVINGLCEALGRVISAFLQFASKYGDNERKEAEAAVIKQLIDIEAGSSTYHRFPGTEKPERISSICDAIAKTMRSHRTRKRIEPTVIQVSSDKPVLMVNDGNNWKPVFDDKVGNEVATKTCQVCYEECVKRDGCWVCKVCGSSKCG